MRWSLLRAEPRQQFFQLLGLNADFADRLAEFGLENSVMAIGDTYLEIVALSQDTAERLLKRRGGDGGYMVICQVDDIAPYRSHTEALKVRKVWDADLPDARRSTCTRGMLAGRSFPWMR